MSDEHDLSDRGTGRTRAYEAPSPQSAANAVDLAAIRAQLDAQASSAATWRWAGGIAAALALSLGGWALALAQQAAVDHVRVDRLEAQERDAADRGERLLEAQTRTIAQLEQLQQTVADLRADVRELRDERRDDEGGRR